jgi:hypothetical protein
MSSITTINAGDLITNSRADINNNFSALNTDKIETSVLDTDTTLAANSDSKVATQKAVKAYVDAGGQANASDTVKGIVELATAAEVLAGTAVGATGASLVITAAYLAGFIVVETSTASTYDFTVDGGQRVIVFCKGNLDNTGNETVTITLDQEAVVKDTVVSNMGSGGDQMPFSLMYTEVPANGTYTLGLTENSSGGISNIKYIVVKLRIS